LRRVKLWFASCVTRKDTCLTNARQRPGREEEKANKQNLQHLYIKVDKKVATPYLINKKKNGKMINIKTNKQDNKGKRANVFECLRRLFQT
jgi:type VI protein secretion system component Hcp